MINNNSEESIINSLYCPPEEDEEKNPSQKNLKTKNISLGAKDIKMHRSR